MSVNALVLRNVVGLFDGMSGLQIALKDMNIHFYTYYASEVDKHAIKQTQHVFPNTIQLGDITKWREWNIDWSMVDLIGAGSPCQGFSFAGKQLAFDDHRSKLFFVFIDILNYARKFNPNVLFLLENVSMKKEHMKVINDYCGVFPVNINSNLVSAQNRNRWYWTNIRTKQVGLFGEIHSDIPQPQDRGILLKDILESEVDEKYYLSDKMVQYLDRHNSDVSSGNAKTNTLTLSYAKQDKNSTYLKVDKQLNPKANQDKASCFTAGAHSGGNHSDMDLICVAMRGRPNNDATKQVIEPNASGKTNCLTSIQKDNLVMQINPSKESGGKQPYQQNRIYDTEGISPALCANKADLLIKQNYAVIGDSYEQDNRAYFEDGKSGTLDLKSESRQKVLLNNYRIRRLTPTECARLQTIPDWYTWIVSDTQQYKMLGNGWTNEVIKHILSYI